MKKYLRTLIYLSIPVVIYCFLKLELISGWVKFYPVLINTVLLLLFTVPSLLFKRSILLKFASYTELVPLFSYRYIRRLTIVWCCFFLINIALATITALSNNLELWLLYNSFISYILLGLLFAGELLLRHYFKSKMKDSGHRIMSSKRSAFLGPSVSYEEFVLNIKSYKKYFESLNLNSISINMDDSYDFLSAFYGAMSAGIKVVLLPNYRSGTINEFSANYDLLIDDYVKENIKVSSNEAVTYVDLKFDTPVILYTSGSTGDPCVVEKTFWQLYVEASNLEYCFGQNICDVFVATVPHTHIYGLLFKCIWPTLTGRSVYRQPYLYPEDFLILNREGRHYNLVSGPAFYKRLERYFKDTFRNDYVHIAFSSGGKLDDDIFSIAQSTLNSEIIEVYGSSETGGIAYRIGFKQSLTIFPHIIITLVDECLRVSSPYIIDKFFQTSDMGEVSGNKLILKGRRDRVVKVEEKRISLDHLQASVNRMDGVQDSYAFYLNEDKESLRQSIKLLVESSDTNIKSLSIRKYLTMYFDPVVIPRDIKVVSKLPYNERGKLSLLELKEIFNDK